jgi:hypothetical protein
MMPEPDREIKERNTLFLTKKVVILLPNYDSLFFEIKGSKSSTY